MHVKLDITQTKRNGLPNDSSEVSLIVTIVNPYYFSCVC